MANYFTKKKYELAPGTLVKCQSGGYLAFYEHRTDIVANGENEKEALKNLRIMYKIVTQEEKQESEKDAPQLPPNTKTKAFTGKVECA